MCTVAHSGTVNVKYAVDEVAFLLNKVNKEETDTSRSYLIGLEGWGPEFDRVSSLTGLEQKLEEMTKTFWI